MTRPLVVLAHGWGLGPSFWTPLREALTGIEIIAVDLGFFGAPAIPTLPEDRPLIGVGHSLGFPWLLRRPERWRGLVSVNGFSRFARTEDFPEGVAPRVLSRMQSRLHQDAEAVAAEFLRRCGIDAPDTTGLQPQAAADGLDWLAQWDARPALAAHRGGLLALAGRADPIVPEAMSRTCFPAAVLRWHEEGSHLLPQSHPDWCAAELISFLRDLQ